MWHSTHRMAHIPWLLLLALPAGIGTGCQTPKSHADSTKGRGNWNVLRAEVKQQLAQKQMIGGAFADAARTLSEAIALDPTHADAYARLAEANLELNNAASAQEVLDAAKRQNLTSASLAYMQGVLDEQNDRFDRALDNYAQARTREPKNVDYVVAEAETLVEQNQPREALKLLQESRGKVDDGATLELLAARIALVVGERTQAVQHYRTALMARWNDDAIREELAVLLADMKRCAEALPLLNQLVEKNGDSYGAVYRALARCTLDLGNPATALKFASIYAAQHPQNPPAQWLRAWAAIAAGDLLTTAVALDALPSHADEPWEVRILRAVLELQRGDLNRAQMALTQLQAENGDDPDVLCLMGEVRIAQQRPEEARHCFEQALRVDPHSEWAKRRQRELS